MEELLFLGGILAVLLYTLYRGIAEGRKRQRALRQTLLDSYGKANTRKWKSGELEMISRYTEEKRGENGIDSLTWEDLNMNELYQQMAYTGSSVGDDYLYFLLHHPRQSGEELQELDNKISYYQQNAEERVKLQVLFHGIGRLRNYSLSQYLLYMEEVAPGKNIPHHLMNALLLLSLCIMGFSMGVGGVLLFLCVCYNFISYFRYKGQMEPYLTSFRYILSLLDFAVKIEKELNPVWGKEKEELQEKEKRFRQFQKNSFLVLSRGRLSGQGMELILDYLRMCFHLDIIKFNSMLKQLQQDMDGIWEIYALLGELDSCLAIGAYRASLPVWCVPQFADNAGIIMDEGYHPLVSEAVPNSLRMKKNILLTGSNASGKSTFLKTMGINILLAQTVYTCAAKSFSLPFCRLFTAISLKDSVFLQESYYMAEIRAIKRILDCAEEGVPVVCMVDEVLRGTNTVERIAASTQILRQMSRMGILCLAATHDGELTKTLEEEFDNYHFEEELIRGDVRFSYQLLPGKAESSNAIRLLEELGYSPQVTEGARKMIEEYRKQGEWR